MHISELSKKYKVKKITEADIPEVYELCKNNPIYYHYYPPFVTVESLKEELQALPPGKTYEDKYYLGFYKKERMIAVMDLIDGYPQKECAWIGFFMMEKEVQGKGIGTEIITDVCTYLNTIGFGKVQLGYIKGNAQSEAFWIKNQFYKTGKEVARDGYVIVVMEHLLDKEICDSGGEEHKNTWKI